MTTETKIGTITTYNHNNTKFVGNKYDEKITTADVKELVTEFIKSLNVKADVKITETQIEVIVNQMPCEMFSENYTNYLINIRNKVRATNKSFNEVRANEKTYEGTDKYTNEAQLHLNEIEDFIQQYRYDISDKLCEYYRCNFYVHVYTNINI